MYVKKSISLLLSGALFASLCTGCSQTTLEHHFFTDTETETEYITPINEIDVTTEILTKLEDKLAEHKIEFEVYLASSFMFDMNFGGSSYLWKRDQDMTYSSITKDSLKSEIEKFSKDKSREYIFACYTKEETVEYDAYDYLNVALKNLKDLYNALDTFDEADWNNLQTALGEETLTFSVLRGFTDSAKSKYVIETSLTTEYIPVP